MQRIFLFGQFRWSWWRFTQYPKDNTTVFKTLWKDAKHNEQFLIHREGDLLYYTYIFSIGYAQRLGIGIVSNKMYLNFPDTFKAIKEQMANSRVTIMQSKYGDIVSTGKSFDNSRVDIDILIRDELNNLILNTFDTGTELPPPNIDISKQDIVTCNLEEKATSWIINKIQEGYHNLYVTPCLIDRYMEIADFFSHHLCFKFKKQKIE